MANQILNSKGNLTDFDSNKLQTDLRRRGFADVVAKRASAEARRWIERQPGEAVSTEALTGFLKSFVARLVPPESDANKTENGQVVFGVPDPTAARAGLVRLYTSPLADQYAEVSADDVLARYPIGQIGSEMIIVKPEANVRYSRAMPLAMQGAFMQGAISGEFLPGTTPPPTAGHPGPIATTAPCAASVIFSLSVVLSYFACPRAANPAPAIPFSQRPGPVCATTFVGEPCRTLKEDPCTSHPKTSSKEGPGKDGSAKASDL